jgi:hypothetical protein
LSAIRPTTPISLTRDSIRAGSVAIFAFSYLDGVSVTVSAGGGLSEACAVVDADAVEADASPRLRALQDTP